MRNADIIKECLQKQEKHTIEERRWATGLKKRVEKGELPREAIIWVKDSKGVDQPTWNPKFKKGAYIKQKNLRKGGKPYEKKTEEDKRKKKKLTKTKKTVEKFKSYATPEEELQDLQKQMKELQARINQVKVKIPKKKRVKKELYPQEKVSKFQDSWQEFQDSVKTDAKEFDEKGKLSYDAIKNKGKKFISQMDIKGFPELKVAAQLATIVELGGLRSQGEGRAWIKHGNDVGTFSAGGEVFKLLRDSNFSSDQLQNLHKLLILGSIPQSKSRKSLTDNIIRELTLRADTR